MFVRILILILIAFSLKSSLFALDSLEKISFDVVQKQLDAYNSKNLEVFLSAYKYDVEVYQFPDSLIYKGIDNMKKVYKEFFERSPKVICRLINRIVNGKYVIDFESISNHTSGIDFVAVAMYEVDNGLIKKVWFLPRKSFYYN